MVQFRHVRTKTFTACCHKAASSGAGVQFSLGELYSGSVQHELKNLHQNYATFSVGGIEVRTQGPFRVSRINQSEPSDVHF